MKKSLGITIPLIVLSLTLLPLVAMADEEVVHISNGADAKYDAKRIAAEATQKPVATSAVHIANGADAKYDAAHGVTVTFLTPIK